MCKHCYILFQKVLVFCVDDGMNLDLYCSIGSAKTSLVLLSNRNKWKISQPKYNGLGLQSFFQSFVADGAKEEEWWSSR